MNIAKSQKFLTTLCLKTVFENFFVSIWVNYCLSISFMYLIIGQGQVII